MIAEQKLDFWIKNNMNALFIGEHGVGKTTVIIDAFKRNNLKYRYFSTATMDPWVDMIGIPKETVDQDGNKFLDLVRPREFALDEIECLFFDEFNRSPAKVRNAVMELIQFRSINGKKFNNLRFVWAAINPEDDEETYDVDRLDPAQRDRFPVQVSIPYKPDLKYFTSKFGPDNAKGAIEWWNALDAKFKKEVSPRRLDYALEMFDIGGDIKDVLPEKCNITKLSSILSNGLAKDKIARLLKEGKTEEVKTMLLQDNVYAEVEPWFLKTAKIRNQVLQLISQERLTKLLSNGKEDKAVLKDICVLSKDHPHMFDTIKTFNGVSQDNELRQLILESIPRFESDNFAKEAISFTATKTSNKAFSDYVISVISNQKWKESTQERAKIIDELQSVPSDCDDVLFISVKECAIGAILHSHADTILDNKEKFFGPLNFLLEKFNIDVTSDINYKHFTNKLVNNSLEKFLWTPKKSS